MLGIKQLSISEEGSNNVKCLTGIKPCLTISYIIQNTVGSLEITCLLTNFTEIDQLWRRHNILLGSTYRNILIKSSDSTTVYTFYRCTFKISASKNQEKQSITFRGVEFESVIFTLSDLDVTFVNCKIHNVSLSNDPVTHRDQRSKELSYLIESKYAIAVEIDSCIISVLREKSTSRLHFNRIYFLYTRSLHLFIKNTKVQDLAMEIQSVFFHISISNSSFTYSKLYPYSVVKIKQSHHTSYMQRNILSFFGSHISYNSSAYLTVLTIYISNIHIVIVNCTFITRSRVLEIAKQITRSGYRLIGFQVYVFYGIMLNISVESSTFKYAPNSESGGVFYIHISRYDTPAVFAKFAVYNSVFIEFQQPVSESSITKLGGAFYINAEKNKFAKGEGVDVAIVGTKFINCSASIQGGSIYLGHNMKKIKISHCSFFSQSPFFSGQGYFIFSENRLILYESIFRSAILQMESSLVAVNKMSDISHVHVQCPEWYFVINDIRETKISIYCSTCNEPNYAPFFDQFEIKYHKNDKNLPYYMTLLYHEKIIETTKCNVCPYGAECPDGKLKLLSGYWGILVDGLVDIYKCPHGYCCQEGLCDLKNSCASNRVGVLCGACKDGFSLSLLSNDCIKIKHCRNYWFWLLISFSALFYTVCYTFQHKRFLSFANAMRKCFRSLSKNKSRCHKDTEVYRKTLAHNFDCMNFFGILMFYVQITTLVHTDLENRNANSLILGIGKTIAFICLLLNPIPKQISLPLCSFHHLRNEQKDLLWIAFFVVIFLLWLLFYLLLLIISYIANQARISKLTSKCSHIKQQLVIGLVEIIKYTYLGFTSVILKSGICLNINGENVWFYDGNQKCFSAIKTCFITFSILHTFIFPVSFAFAQNNIKRKMIPLCMFFWACVFPLFFVVFVGMNVIYRNMKLKGKIMSEDIPYRNKSPTFDTKVYKRDTRSIETTEAIIRVLEGPYQKNSQSMYWESVLCFYRLFFAVTIFAPNLISKYIMIQVICVLCLLHHVLVKPYRHPKSNNAAILSMICLCAVGLNNSIKAGFITIGMGAGPDSVILQILSLKDYVFTLSLFIYVLILGLVCAFNE